MTRDDDVPAVVLDASALLAVLKGEPGGDSVEPVMDGAAMSAVNWAEVLQAYESAGLDLNGRREQIESLGVVLHPFDATQAELTAGLYGRSRKAGLGVADRACLALALSLGARTVTADRAWADLDLGLEITLIR